MGTVAGGWQGAAGGHLGASGGGGTKLGLASFLPGQQVEGVCRGRTTRGGACRAHGDFTWGPGAPSVGSRWRGTCRPEAPAAWAGPWPGPRPQSRCPFAKGGLAGCRRGNAGLRDCRVWGERHSPVMAWGPGPPGERPLLQPTSTAPSGQLGGRGAAGPPLQCSPGTWGARVTAVSSEGDIPGFEGTLSSHPWLRGPFALRLSRHVGHQSF